MRTRVFIILVAVFALGSAAGVACACVPDLDRGCVHGIEPVSSALCHACALATRSDAAASEVDQLPAAYVGSDIAGFRRTSALPCLPFARSLSGHLLHLRTVCLVC
jgi:hypothetical protein